MLTAEDMKVIGLMMLGTAKVMKNILTAIFILDNSMKVKYMDMEDISGWMVKNTKDNGFKVWDKVKVFGKVQALTMYMLVIGLKTVQRATVHTLGQMVNLVWLKINIGDRYDGEWVACRKQGKGADFFANGDTYVGDYKDGRPHGIGIYTWSSGSQYEG